MGERRRRLLAIERKLGIKPGDPIVLGYPGEHDGETDKELKLYDRNVHGSMLLCCDVSRIKIVDNDE